MTDRNLDDARIVFSATLKPYRSLSPRGFAMLLMFIGGTCFASGLLFWSMGAWPITGFFGLDILAIQIAFRLNYRAARAREIVEMTERDLTIHQIDAKGRSQEHHFNPYWARLEVVRLPDWGIVRMALISHGRSLSIGSFLNPDDREAFATSFTDALAKARRVG